MRGLGSADAESEFFKWPTGDFVQGSHFCERDTDVSVSSANINDKISFCTTMCLEPLVDKGVIPSESFAPDLYQLRVFSAGNNRKSSPRVVPSIASAKRAAFSGFFAYHWKGASPKL